MYPVSEQFLQTIRQPVIDYYVDGTIGSVEFDESNIVTGSFHIQNQCTDTSDVILGSVYTGSLTATFYGLNIPRYSWVGKVITPMFYLHVGNTWQSVPLGVYTIKEAKHSAEGVEITAYDNMIKLDKKFKASKFKTAQKMYQHLQTICTACGLTLGMIEQEIQALPNGNTNLGIVGTKSNKYLSYKKYSNDIDTYRDLVFWIAQSMGTFATINRDGELVFRKYKKTTQTVDEITESYRLAGAVFDDFTTNYTGIYVTNTKDGEEIYYGYDVDELTTAIADTQAAIAENEGERMALWTQYQQGEITEEEYKAAVKPLEKRWKNLEKQLEWLNQALVKAQNEEDGLFMDLGENPILQPDGIGSTYAAMRKRVLKALDAISYTPFTCSTVVGVHYDLGDIIQFTGGHATEIGETCCMMAYDFNLNGEFHMQGFGSDPSKPVIKNKNSKKADKADKNGVSAPNVSTGANLPETGSSGDLFIQTGATDISDLNYDGERYDWDNISVEDVDDITFNLTMGGVSTPDLTAERVTYTVDGFTVGKTYNCSFTGQFSSDTTFFNLWGNDVYLHDVPYEQTSSQSRQSVANLVSDLNLHNYSGDFTATASTMYISFTFSDTTDGHYDEFYVKNLKFVPSSNAVESMSVYDNDRWNNIDYVKKVTQTQTSGTEIAEVHNSDGSTTKIYQRDGGLVDDVKVDGTSVVTNKIANIDTMTGAGASAAGAKGLVPAPSAGDNGKFLRGDGTWQTAGGGGSDLELEIDNGEIVATYGAQTEETEPILKDSTGDDIVTMLEAIATEMGALASPEIYAPIIYSTEEREVGVWADGKPLYKRTFSITGGIACAYNTWVNTNIPTPANTEKVIASIASANGAVDSPVLVSCDNPTIYIMNVRNTSVTIVDFTIQYTKTTDVAGSGNYAALGVPAVHYSTNEHVVGTWIDGKPIYEKTVDCGALLNNATKTVAHGIANISKVVEYKGISFDTNGYSICLPYAGFGDWSVSIYANATNIYLQTKQNRTDCVNSYITLRYTKTTD